MEGKQHAWRWPKEGQPIITVESWGRLAWGLLGTGVWWLLALSGWFLAGLFYEAPAPCP